MVAFCFEQRQKKIANWKVKLIFVRVDHRVIIWKLSRWGCSCPFFKEEFQQTDDQDFCVIDLLQRHELNNEFGDPSSPFYRRVSESGHADYILPSPCTASSQALSVNAFRWCIRVEQPGDALKTLETRQDYI